MIGPVLFIWLSWSILVQVKQQANLEDAIRNIKEAAYGSRAPQFWMVLILMLLNWGLEALKWKWLLASLEKTSLLRSFKAVLAGVALALNTPNRIGEYGGRVLYVSEGKRIPAISLSIAGSFSQLIITLLMGGLGLIFSGQAFLNTASAESMYLLARVLVWGVFTTATGCLLLYFRLGWIVRSFLRIPGLSYLVKQLAVLENLNVTILLRVLALSFLRYLVFVLQYILLLQVMHVEIAWWPAFWLIAILYLVLAVIPTITLLELGIRGKASILLFKLYSANTVGIYATATGIWLVNLLVPALAGSLLIIGVKIFNEKQ